MNRSVLYIVGNGFDIHHGLDSHYSDFKEYLLNHDKNLHGYVINYLPVEEDWSELEDMLAHLDVDYLVSETEGFLYPYSSEDWSDSYHHDYQYELERVITALSHDLKAGICKWITQLDIPVHENLNCPALDLDREGLFLNFNYTSTLEHIYQVPERYILFIHGKCSAKNSEIVLGHGWNPKELPDLNDVPDPEGMDLRVVEGNSIINDYFGATFKPTDKIIERNRHFFDNLSSVSEIYTLGHSLSEVDLPYIKMVVDNAGSGSLWKVSHHKKGELQKHKTKMNQLGVENVEFFRLQDIAR